MRLRSALTAALTLASTASADASWRDTLYGSVPIDSDARLVAAYERTLIDCTHDASFVGDARSDHYDVVLRACLYRRGFFEGTHAYPVVIDR